MPMREQVLQGELERELEFIGWQFEKGVKELRDIFERHVREFEGMF